MAHIFLPEGIPGIVGPLMLYPDTAKPLGALAEALLRTDMALTPAERELVAAYVSYRNECTFCSKSHAAAARHLWGLNKRGVVDEVLRNPETAAVSDKMKALLAIAGSVQKSGRNVQADDVEKARAAGADDRAIHDTVLIAAAFCMFNRYVDGLATWAPEDDLAYEPMGARLAMHGYAEAV